MQGPTGLVHPIYARLLRMLLQQAEVDSDRVLAAAALDWQSLLKADQQLHRSTVVALILAALRATGKPWLGLELGHQAPVSAHGPLGYAAVTAPTLQHGLRVLARYGAVREDSLVWSFHRSVDGGILQVAGGADWGEARGFVMDAVAASLVRVLQAALGELPGGLQIDLPLALPAWESRYRHWLPMDVRFGQEALALHVPAKVLALPLLGADARAHAAACQECEAALAQSQAISMAQRVADLIGRSPEGVFPQLQGIAAQCGLSERTVIRRLAADGTSFQQLLDAHMQQRALWLLQNTQLSIEAIATRLGYADTSNFSRTVKRWFGATPSALRCPEPARTG